MIPPWDKHPELGRGHLGYGEKYMNSSWQWFSRLSDEERSAYEARFPEAGDWRGFYERIRAHPWLK